MGDLRRMGEAPERRTEPRTEVELCLTIWGVDTRGEPFLQEARARDISRSGALLCEIESELRSGDVIGILYANRKARFRVVWVRYDGNGGKIKAAIHRMPQDECPWRELLDAAEGKLAAANQDSATP